MQVTEMSEIKVDKVEAATRQIELAIRLLFQNEDPIGIHTLAAAGFRIVRDLGKAKSGEISQHLTGIIKPGMEGMFWKVFSRAANFFKHADNDPDGVLENVQEEINDVLILFACFFYRDIESHWTPQMAGFVAWYILFHPEILDYLQDDPVMRQIVQSQEICTLRNKSRDERLCEGKIVIERAALLKISI
jgi:hypothetical protein